MKVCIDIDNTILNFEPLFYEATNKNPLAFQSLSLLKDELKAKGHEEWIKIQGKVYGELISKVEVFPNVRRFIEKQRELNNQVFLVSHKTNKSYCGNHDDLHLKTKNKLQDLGILDLVGEENVFFKESLLEKISKIKEIDPQIIIDDLEKIITHKELEHIPYRIQFIDSEPGTTFFASDWIQITEITSFLNKKQFKVLSSLSTGRNCVLKIEHEGKSYVLKIFSLDDRYKREKKLLNELDDVPKVYESNDEGRFLFMEYIDGKYPDSFSSLVQNALQNIWSSKIDLQATHQRLNLDSYIQHIHNRLKKDLNHFRKFDLLLNSLEKRISQSSYIPRHVSFCTPDLTLDNLIINSKNDVIFIDLESAGMDDPLRSFANAIFHSRAFLDHQEIKNLAQFFNKTYPNIFSESFELIMDLVAFDWLLLERNPQNSIKIAEAYKDRLQNGNICFSLDPEILDYVRELS